MTAAESSERRDLLAAETADADPTQAARALLRARARAVRHEQLARARADLDLTEAEAAAIERLADRLVTRMLAAPRRTLATADGDRPAVTVRQLFADE